MAVLGVARWGGCPRILRAAFMSDEPVRGAPSVDAFSVEKKETKRGAFNIPLSLVILYLSFVLLFTFALASFLDRGIFGQGNTRLSKGDSICARATRDRIYLKVIFVGQGLFIFFFSYCLPITSVILEELPNDFLSRYGPNL